MLRPLGMPVVLLCVAGCAAPPHPADATLTSSEIRADLFTAPQVRLHRYSAAGARIPDAAFTEAVATIERHLGRGIEVIDHGEQAGGWSADGPTAPIQDGGRAVSVSDVAAAGGRYTLAAADHGIVGVADRSSLPGHEGEPSRLLPLAEDGTIIVVEWPGTEDGGGVTGFTSMLVIGSELKPGVVVLCRSAIHRRSNWFVSESKLTRWTLTHEIGHVLGVPASSTHKWIVPGLGVHCTHPECVMYTGVDWRVVVTGLLKGWPLDFCDPCKAELERARVEAAGGAAGGSPTAVPK
jgi:hypothetical protein